MDKVRRFIRKILDIEVWMVGGVVAATMLSTRLLLYSVIIGMIFWPLRKLVTGRWTKRTPVDIPIIIILIWLPITLIASAMYEVSFPQVLRILCGILFFYAIVNSLDSYKKIGWFVDLLVMATLFLVCLAPFSVEWSPTKLNFLPSSLYKFFSLKLSDSINPNALAGTLVFLFPLVLGGLYSQWRYMPYIKKSLYLVTTLGILSALLLSQSRTGIMSGVLIIILLLVMQLRWGWILILFSTGVFVWIIIQNGSLHVLETLATSSTLGGLDGRIEVWSRAIYMIQDFPFTGVGFGLYGFVADTLYPLFLFEPGKIPHSHNIFLQVAVDMGLPGLIAWLSIFGTIAFITFRIYKLGRDSSVLDAKYYGSALFCCTISLGLFGIFASVLWGMLRPAPLVWVIWGLAIAIYNLVISSNQIGS